jgi:large subunit ribosomal protein L15
MKLHDLQPAPGSRTPRTRVGRGIAAGKGKTAGRGTKGQKARAGSSIPAWFEGGQTPLHQRIPKLRGFKNRFKIHYEVVNVGAIGELAERGAFEVQSTAKGATGAPVTINQDILRAVGLVRTLDKPLKVLGAGELTTALFVVADAFTASARAKIEGAGGTVNVLEVPTSPLAALGATRETATDRKTDAKRPSAKAKPAPAPAGVPGAMTEADAPEAAAQTETPEAAQAPAVAETEARPPRKASANAEAATEEPAPTDEPEATETAAAAGKPSRRSSARPAGASDAVPADASDAEPADASDDVPADASYDVPADASDDAAPGGDDA